MTDSQNKNSAAVILQEKKSHVRFMLINSWHL